MPLTLFLLKAIMEHEDLESIRISEPALLIGARGKYRYSDYLAKKLTQVTRFGDEYKLYEKVGDFMYVPRGICTVGPDTVDKRVQGFSCGFKSRIKPRNEEQKRVIDECWSLVKEGENFTVRAATGTGKSLIALEMAARLNKPTLITVPETTLMDQFIERAQQFLDIPKNRIGIIQQDICDYKGKWLVIGMLQSLALKENYPRDMYEYFGLVQIDECHKSNAEELSRMLGLFSARGRVAYSATPDRTDGRELVVQSHVGPTRVVSDTTPVEFKVMRYNSTWACPRREITENGYTYWKKLDHTPARCGHVINHIAKHDTTNRRIADYVKKAYDKGRYIMVFSDRLNHLDELMTQSARKGVPAHDMHTYVGGASKAEIKKAKTKRVLFGTYQKMGTGVDLPWFSVCVLATPRANVKQFIGRILREHPDKGTAIVFDIAFDDSPVFKKYTTARDKLYQSVKASVKIVNEVKI